MPSILLSSVVVVSFAVSMIFSDHGFGSGRFFDDHNIFGVDNVSGDDVDQLLDEVQETSSNDLVHQLINMMKDPL